MSRLAKIMEMLEKAPDDVFLNFGLAIEKAKEGKLDQALERFDRVLQLDPTYTAAYFHKGNTLIGVQRIEEARVILTAGVEAAIAHADAHAQREMRELLDSIN